MAAIDNSWATRRGIGSVAIVFWLAMLALPLLGNVYPSESFDYYLFMGQSMMVYAIAVLGLNLLTGFNGQISLGHGAFFALGAYVTAILMNDGNWPYWTTLPVVAILCFGAGFLFGFPALKLESHYLALATFTLAIAVPQILKHKAIAGWTGGVAGLVLEKPDAPFGLPLSPDQWLFYFSTPAWPARCRRSRWPMSRPTASPCRCRSPSWSASSSAASPPCRAASSAASSWCWCRTGRNPCRTG